MNLENREIFTTYDRVLILCNLDNKKISPMRSKMESDKYDKYKSKLILIPGDMKMLKNKYHKERSTIIERYLLKPFNHNKLELENDEVVLPLLELNVEDAYLYASLYQNNITIERIAKIKILYSRYNCDNYGFPLKQKISTLLLNMKDTNYWANKYNLNLNITKQFNRRSFQYNGPNDSGVVKYVSFQSPEMKMNEKQIKIIDRLIKNPKGSDYLRFINIEPRYHEQQKSSYYRIEKEECVLTKQQIYELFKIISNDEKRMYDLFNALLLSKKMCHLVLNNEKILKIMQPIIKKYMPLYKLLIGYGWLHLYNKEKIMKTMTTKKSDYVFNINTANKLLFFPHCQTDLHMNPYVTLLMNRKSIGYGCFGLPMISTYNEYGIDTLSNFKKKMNIFMTNDPDFELISPEEMKKIDLAICGSIMTACVKKRDPLIDLVSDNNSTFTTRIKKYFNEYYKNSDIDIMCNRGSVFGFLDSMNELTNTIDKKLREMTPSKEKLVKTYRVKSLLITISMKYIKEHMKEYDPEYIKKELGSGEMKQYFYKIYIDKKYELNKKMRKKYSSQNNQFYEDYFDFVSVKDQITFMLVENVINDKKLRDDSIYIRDSKKEIVLKISEGYKYRIKSSLLPRDLEIFRTKYRPFFSCVSRFHLPCVRCYYDGDDVYLLPSCITAYLTGINMDIKYFSGHNTPMEIVNKYGTRGYRTVINKKEKTHLVEYNSQISKWNDIFNINIKDERSVLRHLSHKILRDDIYKPTRAKKYKKLNKKYIITVEDLYMYYKEKYNYDMKKCGIDILKFKTIDKNGNVNKLKKWLLEATYDMINKL